VLEQVDRDATDHGLYGENEECEAEEQGIVADSKPDVLKGICRPSDAKGTGEAKDAERPQTPKGGVQCDDRQEVKEIEWLQQKPQTTHNLGSKPSGRREVQNLYISGYERGYPERDLNQEQDQDEKVEVV
jgi:hypothetical protein